MRCPNCNSTVGKPAVEGGVILKSLRYLRVDRNGIPIAPCPQCRAELMVPSGARTRLVLYRSRISGSGSESSPPPSSRGSSVGCA